MRKKIARPLVFSADGAYAFPTIVCMTSIFLNSPHLDFDTYWITSSRPHGANSPAILAAADRLSDTFERRIAIVPIDDSCFDSFRQPSQLPYLGNVTYNWLLVPVVLRCDSYLLLDSDIVVQDELDFLLSLEMGNNIIAGVDNGTEQWTEENKRLGLPGDNVYVNTGVMIVNALRWRQEQIFDALMDWYRRHSGELALADQDMINAVLSNRKIVLNQKWNTQQHTFLKDDLAKFDPEAFRGIFHFSGPDKPWVPEAHPNLKALFEKYARVTPALKETEIS
jgi:lipopolysaccharide biosynthesis glycosyltransferase